MSTRELAYINGHFYSFASIEPEVDGVVYEGVTAIEYAGGLTPGLMRGSRSQIEGRTPGEYATTGSMEMVRHMWDRLRDRLGPGWGRKTITIGVQYADEGQPVVSDTLVGVRLGETRNGGSEGPDALKTKIALHIWEIQEGTKRLSALGDASIEDDLSGGEGPPQAASKWDRCKLGDYDLPGICRVTAAPTRQVDKKKHAGKDGARITLKGYDPGPVTIEVTIWTKEQLTLLEKAVAGLWKPPGKEATGPVDIIAYELGILKIRSVQLVSPSALRPGPKPGSRVMNLNCLEFVEPKSTGTKTPKGSKARVDDRIKGKHPLNELGDPPSKTASGPEGED